MIGAAALVGVVVVAVWATVDLGESVDETPVAEAAARTYLRTWEREAWDELAALVAEPPAEFMSVHADTFESLRLETAGLELVDVQVDGMRAAATFHARLELGGFGDWAYDGSLELVRLDDSWLVDWSPATIHPDLTAGRVLRLSVAWPERAPILARDRTSLVEPLEIIVVGVEPQRIKNRKKMLHSLEQLLNVDADRVGADLDAPGVQPDWFIPVAELRPQRFEKLESKLRPIPGVVFRRELARLSPAEGFAEHVLGRVGEITAERLDELGFPYRVGDIVGLSGLERELEPTLAGVPSARVELADTAGEVVVLREFAGKAPEPAHTTLDPDIQSAAEKALMKVKGPSALVAVDARSGAIRAVVSRPVEEFNRALAGRYPPGSTFKIVTAAALLENGLSLDDTVPCPAETTVGGARFRNAGGSASGSTSFLSAFAQSCNTAFVELATQLDEAALAETARLFGFGAPYDLPIDVAGGRFDSSSDLADRATAAIGQGQVEASPVHLASVAATVANGVWHPPRLLAGEAVGDGVPLPQNVIRQLRQMMQSVVTDGTGQAAQVPDVTIAGKTGSAEFGEDDPPQTHAWFVGFQDQLAFAVLVEGGGSGGKVAAPIAARFIRELNRADQ